MSLIAALFFALQIVLNRGQEEIKYANECTATADLPWSYGPDNGPDKWDRINGQCRQNRSRQKQSPINLYLDIEMHRYFNTNFSFVGYDVPMNGIVYNTGNRLVFYPTDCKERYIRVFDQKCYLKHINFHFGANSSTGSNHQINGNYSALEVDVAHQCPKKDAIVAFLLDEVERETPQVENLAEVAKLVKYQGDKGTTRNPINLLNLTSGFCYSPSSGKKGYEGFFVYNGSYMYPPCTENVTWIVMYMPSRISSNLMENFRNLRSTTRDSDDQCYLYPNTRPLSAPNRRYINLTESSCAEDVPMDEERSSNSVVLEPQGSDSESSRSVNGKL